MLWHLPLCTTVQITSEQGLSLIYTFSSVCSYIFACEYLKQWKLHILSYCDFSGCRCNVCCGFSANEFHLR